MSWVNKAVRLKTLPLLSGVRQCLSFFFNSIVAKNFWKMTSPAKDVSDWFSNFNSGWTCTLLFVLDLLCFTSGLFLMYNVVFANRIIHKEASLSIMMSRYCHFNKHMRCHDIDMLVSLHNEAMSKNSPEVRSSKQCLRIQNC